MLLFTYYGHAAFALNNAKRKLLFDPFFTGNPAATTAADVITCNYILVSHGHGDHLGDTAHIAQKTGATVIGCPAPSATRSPGSRPPPAGGRGPRASARRPSGRTDGPARPSPAP